MSNIKASVDEYGLLNNVLSKGLQLNLYTALKEFIDNSIDADAKTIEIIIDNSYIYIKDDGNGMNENALKNFVTLCKINSDPSKNGYYGIGAKASLSLLINKYGGKKTIIFTNDVETQTEIKINWGNINEQRNNPNAWSENITVQGITRLSDKEWESNSNINFDKTGTSIIIEYDEKFKGEILNSNNIKQLVYDINKTYYYSITKNNTKIKINISGKEFICDNKSVIDSIRYNEIKDKNKDKTSIDFRTLSYDIDFRDTVTVYSKYNFHYINKEDKHYYKIIVIESNNKEIENKTYFYDGIHKIKSKNKGKNNDRFLIEEHEDPDLDVHFNTIFDNSDIKSNNFDYYVTWVNKDILKCDTDKLKEDFGSSSASFIAGLYFVRNNRILSTPISLDKCRNNQDGNKWRGSMIFDTNSIITDLVHPAANKSSIKKETIDQNLHNVLAYVTKQTYDTCRDYLAKKEGEKSLFCQKCNLKNTECICCKKCKKKIVDNECGCCKKCKQKIVDSECGCCKMCKKNTNKCECCMVCNLKKKNCICCNGCHKKLCECCGICKKLICECCSKCHNIIKNCDCCEICSEIKRNCECDKPCGVCPNIKKECDCCKNPGCRKYNCEICENPNCKKKKCLNECSCNIINKAWKTIDDSKDIPIIKRNNVEDTYEIVYIVQPDQFWNTNIFKIGRSTQPIMKSNTIKRFRDGDYGDFLKIISVHKVVNSIHVEKEIIKNFKTHFNIYNKKKEFFIISDETKMHRVFLETIISFL